MNSYQQENRLLDNTTQVVGASATAQAVSKVYALSAADSINHLVAVTFDDVTVTNAVTVILQDSPDGSTWSTYKSASVSGDGVKELEINLNNASDTNPWPLVRVVVTTGVDDAATVTSIVATRRI